MATCCVGPEMVPLASSVVVDWIVPRTSFEPMPMPAMAAGSYCTRTAGCWPPATVT